MATLQMTVPDTLMPRVVEALTSRYPDLTGTDAEIAEGGIKQLLTEALSAAEARAAELAGYDAMTTAAEDARAKAIADAAEIS